MGISCLVPELTATTWSSEHSANFQFQRLDQIALRLLVSELFEYKDYLREVSWWIGVLREYESPALI